MLTRRNFWIVMLVLLLAGLLVFWGSKSRSNANANANSAANTNAAPVAAKPAPTLEFLASDIIEVKAVELRQILTVSGALRAVNQAAVKARIAGDVDQVLVREGESVKANQVLVKMDTREYQARLEQAKGALNAARGQLDIAAKTRDNNRALLEKNFISKNAFENAESQYQIALANVNSAKGALDLAQKSASDTVIRAPIDGVISSRSVQPGEKISADNRLLEIVDLRQMELEAAVPTSEITKVAIGQAVEIHVNGVQAPFMGRVVRINPAIQSGSRSIPVYIQVANPQNLLKAGMFGEAQLVVAKKSEVLAVPRSAIRTDASTSFVYVIDNGTLNKKPVQIGIEGSSGQMPATEILSGLRAGERLVASNLGDLRTGAPVKILAGSTANGGNGGSNGGNSGNTGNSNNGNAASAR